ncbi:MAG: GTP cyclohydrolase I FolE [Patescibacteria group bacterium]|nr:GTP cyclohydrolase I FolE [Patescibacteria group bacterium]
MEKLYKKILEKIGEDPTRQGLSNTPQRAAKAFKFLTKGYEENLDEIINGAIYDMESNDMIICRDIELYSLCEHHMLPFIGKCHIGYIPDKKVIGLSKLARIVDYFAKRLQIQERLTREIAEAVQKYTNPIGVAVVVEAQHLCMMMRGVEKQNSSMQTSTMLGQFRKSHATRQEFLSLIAEKR